MTADELALTGCNFFPVTRTLMLTVSLIIHFIYLKFLVLLTSILISILIIIIIKVAGTIVTYEIVLIQFNSVTNEAVNQNNTKIYCP